MWDIAVFCDESGNICKEGFFSAGAVGECALTGQAMVAAGAYGIPITYRPTLPDCDSQFKLLTALKILGTD